MYVDNSLRIDPRQVLSEIFYHNVVVAVPSLKMSNVKLLNQKTEHSHKPSGQVLFKVVGRFQIPWCQVANVVPWQDMAQVELTCHCFVLIIEVGQLESSFNLVIDMIWSWCWKIRQNLTLSCCYKPHSRIPGGPFSAYSVGLSSHRKFVRWKKRNKWYLPEIQPSSCFSLIIGTKLSGCQRSTTSLYNQMRASSPSCFFNNAE